MSITSLMSHLPNFFTPILPYLAIGGGGAFGAIARHGMNKAIMNIVGLGGFPFGILSINILGCFLMGVLSALFITYWNPSQMVKLFLITGFLGGFTTFSTFSLDVMTLWSRGAVLETLVYIAISIIFSILAIFMGFGLITKIYGG